MERVKLGPLECLVKKTKAGAPVLVALHGRGASADDLADLGDMIDPGLNQVYPDAPRPWPAMGSMGPRSGGTDRNPMGLCWYDSGPDRAAEIADSRKQLMETLGAVKQVSEGPLILMGFSQGALMTLDTGLREGSPAKLLIALSGYLNEPVGGPESPPVLIVHGAMDDVVPVHKGRDAHGTCVARGVRATYEEYPMAHEIRPAVVKRIARFIQEAKL